MVILKKCVSLLMVILMLVSLTAACAGGNDEVTPETITNDIFEYVDKDIIWVSLKKDELNSYFGFSGENVTAHSAFINDSEQKYDIVAAFEFEDRQTMRAAVEKVNISLDAAIQNFKSVIDTETEKIMNRVILSKENILVIVVSSNTPKIKEMLTEKDFSSVV